MLSIHCAVNIIGKWRHPEGSERVGKRGCRCIRSLLFSSVRHDLRSNRVSDVRISEVRKGVGWGGPNERKRAERRELREELRRKEGKDEPPRDQLEFLPSYSSWPRDEQTQSDDCGRCDQVTRPAHVPVSFPVALSANHLGVDLSPRGFVKFVGLLFVIICGVFGVS